MNDTRNLVRCGRRTNSPPHPIDSALESRSHFMKTTRTAARFRFAGTALTAAASLLTTPGKGADQNSDPTSQAIPSAYGGQIN